MNKIEKLVCKISEIERNTKDFEDFERCHICGSNLQYTYVDYGIVKNIIKSKFKEFVCAINIHIYCAECGKYLRTLSLHNEDYILKKFGCKLEADANDTLQHIKFL